MLSRWRASRSNDDAGVTLIEMVVGMTLAAILGALTLTMVVAITNSASASTDRVIGAAQARTTLQAWASYLRVADGTTPGSPSHRFEWITGTDMLFYADLNTRTAQAAATAPVMVWLRSDTSKQLVEEQFAFDTTVGAYPRTPKICRILATNVGSLTFTPYTASSSDTDFGGSLAPSGSGCLSLTRSVTQSDATANSTLAKIVSVGVDMVVTNSTGGASQEYQTLATVPSLMGS
jgi:prepilin-type N-terminal cleavage/methylation domain-containing protein